MSLRGTLIAAVLAAARVSAAAPDAEPAPSPSPAPDSGPPRIVRIGMKVDLDPARSLVTEEATVRVEGKGGDTLRFRIGEDFTVERAVADRGVAEFRKSGSHVDVVLAPPLDGPRTVTFRVTGQPQRDGKPLIGAAWAALGAEDLWYPALDRVLAETEIEIHVPPGWTAVAPGVRQKATKPGTWIWRSKAPLRHLAVAAAPGLELSEAAAVRVPFTLAAPDGAPGAAAVAERLRDATAWFSASFGPYPYESFDLVLLPGFPYRMRASGLVVAPAKVALDGASDGADLLAGQWFGERLAATGRLMDAFAAWAATVFARDRGLPPPSEIVRLREAYFRLRSGDEPIARASAATPEAVLRGKGSAAPEMILLVVGSRDFFAAVRSLFAAPARDPLSLAEIRAAFEAASGKPLEKPFTEWFERSGAPEFEAKLRSLPAAEGGWRVDVELVQKRGVYSLPVDVVLLGPGVEHRVTLDVTDEKTSPFYVLPFKPLRVEIDPGHKIFRWP